MNKIKQIFGLFFVCSLSGLLLGCGGDGVENLPCFTPTSECESDGNSGGYNGSYGSLYYEGRTYKTVVIGRQTWMAENLNYNASGSKCYNNSESNCTTYGRLYNWETAKAVCPYGWHLPTQADWEVMTAYIGGSSIEGRKLKARSGWNNNGNGTDEYGFSALPGGRGSSGGSFNDVGDSGHWWSASESEDDSDGA